MSAVTPDLYRPMYGAKVVAFFDGLLDPKFAGKPFMRHYLDYYWDIYWDLHLGVKGDAIPPQVRTIGESFNTVLAFRDPTQPVVYDNYMTVRALLDFLRNWIDERLDDISNGRIANPEKTIAWYWLKNAGDGAHFSKKDVVFECFHNFVALSQWGNSIFGIMSRLSQDGGDPEVRAAFEKTMSGNPDAANGAPYTPLEMFVMELFRTISPNGGSISSISDTRQAGSSDNYGDSVSPFVRFGLPYERSGYIISPHTSTSFDPMHWTNPQQFDPGRYRDVPTSAQVDEAKSKQIGFAKCPFDLTTMKVSDGRNAALANSAFGTVFGVVDWQAAAGLRLRRVRAIRLRVSPLPRRAAHHPGVRGLPAQGLARQDKLPQFEFGEPASGADRSERRHRRQHHLRPAGLIGKVQRLGCAATEVEADLCWRRLGTRLDFGRFQGLRKTDAALCLCGAAGRAPPDAMRFTICRPQEWPTGRCRR